MSEKFLQNDNEWNIYTEWQWVNQLYRMTMSEKFIQDLYNERNIYIEWQWVKHLFRIYTMRETFI